MGMVNDELVKRRMFDVETTSIRLPGPFHQLTSGGFPIEPATTGVTRDL